MAHMRSIIQDEDNSHRVPTTCLYISYLMATPIFLIFYDNDGLKVCVFSCTRHLNLHVNIIKYWKYQVVVIKLWKMHICHVQNMVWIWQKDSICCLIWFVHFNSHCHFQSRIKKFSRLSYIPIMLSYIFISTIYVNSVLVKWDFVI